MFKITYRDIKKILHDYHISTSIKDFSELQRNHYQNNHFRLIIKVNSEDSTSIVLRLKNEKNTTIELIESQCQFAETLKNNGIITPTQYKANATFANVYHLDGYDVIVTAEQFVKNEVKIVDESIAQKTGELLAKIHNVSELNNLHVNHHVLFNPFKSNDLFDYNSFYSLETQLHEDDKHLFYRIVNKYNDYMKILSPLKNRPQYAVQGDMSDCNTYLTPYGELGVFDFNWSGDNCLFCDAVMHSVFEAKNMDYPESRAANFEMAILNSFLQGYCSIRDFSIEEKQWYPYLYAIITAFWSADIYWDDNSLINLHKSGDIEGVRKHLSTIWERLTNISDFKISFQ